MSDRAFLDTNVLVYALVEQDRSKRQVAHQLLASLPKSQAVISYQVLQEFSNVCLRRLTPKPRPERVRGLLVGMLEQFEVVPWSPMLLPAALEVHYRYGFQWYDSLIVAAAMEAKCAVLYSEDMQGGQRIEGLQVVNPFV